MHLIDNWLHVLNKAWSARFGLLGAAFAGGGMALPVFSDFFSPKHFLILCMVCCIGSVVARLVDQPKMRGDDE